MQPIVSTLVEAYLLIEQPRQRLTHWIQALAPLDSSHAPPLATVVAYYDPTADEAILGLRYDALALGTERLAYVVEVALLAEIGMVQPAELSDGDRKRFMLERLARCTVQITNQRNVVSAIGELVRLVRETKTIPPSPPVRPSAPPVNNTVIGAMPMRPPALPRGTRDDLDALEQPAVSAKSTRDLEPPAPPRTDHPRAERRSDTRLTSKNVVVRSAGSGSLPKLPPPPPPSKRLLQPQPEEVEIVDGETEVPRRPRSPSQLLTTQFMPPAQSTTPATPAVIYARYLRSGRWVPIRIGALSLKGAALLTGALPRLHDHVDVALTFGGHRALVRGAVGKVSSDQEACSSGAATFSVNFELDDAARRQLTTLLTAARAANITIKPPPPRATRRFPIEWPMCLGTTRGAVRAQALDISLDGMFVRPTSALTLDSSLSFSAVLDDGGAPISGRARVVRQISDATGRAAGLASGFGLQVVDMGEADRKRWVTFVARIEKRADKRVLIGASPGRLAELQATLAALGYAVTGGTDPGALVQLARGEARPVDAALIDAGWLSPQMSASWVESLFSARDVPCLTLHGDPRGARQAVDKLLLDT